MKARLVKLIVVLCAVGVLVGCELPQPPGAPTPTAVPGPTSGAAAPQAAEIIADGVVVPQRTVNVTFDSSGTIAEVLVNEGDTVAAGAPLARLDTRDLALQVVQSKANLSQAQAAYNKIEAGATPDEIAAQQAQVRNAQANLERTRQGSVTAADIASAQAQLRQAEAALALLRNPTAGDLSAAQEAVRQAEINLQSTRDSASQTKTTSELNMKQAADQLTQVQAQYSKAKSDWDYAQTTGKDPVNPNTTNAEGKRVDNKISDSQRAQYYSAFVQAEAALRSAEKSVTEAQVAFDQARQNEVQMIQTAESQLANTRAQLVALQNPDANRIAQQQAVVDQARANLRKAQQGGTKAEIAAAQAIVDQQQASLEGLQSPPRTVDLAEAQARIEAAQASLEQSERQVEKATLQAPFGGVVAERNVEVGQHVGSTGADAGTSSVPFVIAEIGTWKIETNNLNERDVVRIRVGSTAQIRFDALPNVVLGGKVTAISPRGMDQYGDKTYTVTITPDARDERLRWNMSASVQITPTS